MCLTNGKKSAYTRKKQGTKSKRLNPYPSVVCWDCGIKASGGKAFEISTWYLGVCDVCSIFKNVTQPRDFYYPKFKGHKK